MSYPIELTDYWPDELEWLEDSMDLGLVLQDALDEGYADAEADEMAEVLEAVLDEMSPAEAFSFSKALKAIQGAGGQALAVPIVNQAVRTGLPLGAGALGTVIGGPVGTALGSKLGSAAAKALPGRPGAKPTAPGTPTAVVPPVASGSAAAAQGLVLTQQPDVLQALLALAMGQQGQQAVNGVPVAAVMNMLSSIFGQAAADADELMYLEAGDDGESAADAIPGDRSLYVALMDADNYEMDGELS